MAIQPVDLQLAYLAAPASAAAANVVQQAPEVAAQAAQAAFISHVQQREETIEETTHAEGTKIRPDPEGGQNAGTYQPRKRRRHCVAGAAEETMVETESNDDSQPHFIDTMA
jgi:hypothetical protein